MILERIDSPKDLKIIRPELLPKLCEELREKMVDTVSKTGGHLASSLGCVELTVALHYVFNAPQDKFVWDVGHQTYAHKLITGRRDKFDTLRQHDGISGFTRRVESEYDSFGAGHSSTSISAALGMAIARDLQKEDYKVVSIIGDGGLTGGIAFEALNNVGHLKTDLLVILNDNEMFISRRVGAVAGYLTKILTLGLVKQVEKKIEQFFSRLHFGLLVLRVAKRFKVMLFPGMLFEEMGFAYLGPIDGHDLKLLIQTLDRVKKFKGPVLLHVITKKGKGYPPAEKEPTKFHGIGKFDKVSGESVGSKDTVSYTQTFSQTMVKLSQQNPKICAITAAMCDGTGLQEFATEFPDRFYDVGIAEQHALTFAAGLAVGGMRPVCAIYSTFLQRGFDQIVHDIALQKLPVVLAIDRAGIVGEDGATHHGVFDLSYLQMIPNMVIMSPKDENELQHMLNTAFSLNLPVAVRYPRGAGFGVKLDSELQILSLGKAEVLREFTACSMETAAIFAIGNMVYPSLTAAEQLSKKGIECSVINLRYAKPLDEDLIIKVAQTTKNIVTVEENVLTGGVGQTISSLVKDSGCRVEMIGLPDKFVEHGKIDFLRDKYGLSSDKIAEKIKNLVK